MRIVSRMRHRYASESQNAMRTKLFFTWEPAGSAFSASAPSAVSISVRVGIMVGRTQLQTCCALLSYFPSNDCRISRPKMRAADVSQTTARRDRAWASGTLSAGGWSGLVVDATGSAKGISSWDEHVHAGLLQMRSQGKGFRTN